MKQKGRLEFAVGRHSWWTSKLCLDELIEVWLKEGIVGRYRWVEGGAVVYLPRCER